MADDRQLGMRERSVSGCAFIRVPCDLAGSELNFTPEELQEGGGKGAACGAVVCVPCPYLDTPWPQLREKEANMATYRDPFTWPVVVHLLLEQLHPEWDRRAPDLRVTDDCLRAHQLDPATATVGQLQRALARDLLFAPGRPSRQAQPLSKR